MARGHREIPKTFTKWPRDGDEGALGYSFKLGDLRGEMHPDKKTDGVGLTFWHAYAWIDGDMTKERVIDLWEDNHWDAADALHAEATGLQ